MVHFRLALTPGFVIRIAKEAIKLNCTKKIHIRPEQNIKKGKFNLDIKHKYIA